MPYTSDRRLYLTADDRVVEEGDPDAATLLVGEGGTVDDETAKRYNLKAKPTAADEKAREPVANKAVAKAPANKARE